MKKHFKNLKQITKKGRISSLPNNIGGDYAKYWHNRDVVPGSRIDRVTIRGDLFNPLEIDYSIWDCNQFNENITYRLYLDNNGCLHTGKSCTAPIKLKLNEDRRFLTIEFNPTKIMFGTNAIEYTSYNLDDFLGELENILDKTVPDLDVDKIKRFRVMKFEYGINIQLSHKPYKYLNVLKEAPAKQGHLKLKIMENSVYYVCGTHEIKFYDKTKEQIDKSDNNIKTTLQLMNQNMLRYEVMLKQKKIESKGVFNKNINFAYLFTHELKVQMDEILESYFNKYFYEKINHIFDELNAETIIKQLDEKDVKHTPANILNTFGEIYLKKQQGVEGGLNFIEEVLGEFSSRSKSRYRSKLSKAAVICEGKYLEELKDEIMKLCDNSYTEHNNSKSNNGRVS